MRIYIAGYWSAHFGSSTAHARVSGLALPDWVLESFHYIGGAKSDKLRFIQQHKRSIFLDSGAFSMFTQGIEVNLSSYANFIKKYAPIIHIASNLDAIGSGQEQKSYSNQKELERMGVEIKPVHHARDRDPWLQKYLDEGYDHIFLGGMVPENTPYLKEWLDHIWHHYLTDKDGKPKVKVHGFGLTTLSLMFRYPWYSVDSTTWVMTSRFGGIFMDFPNKRGGVQTFKVDFSNRSTKQEDINSWHYFSLTKAEQHRVLARLEELEAERIKYPEMEETLGKAMGFEQGYNVKALSESYGWRDHFNVHYFRRVQEQAVKTFKREQESLFT